MDSKRSSQNSGDSSGSRDSGEFQVIPKMGDIADVRAARRVARQMSQKDLNRLVLSRHNSMQKPKKRAQDDKKAYQILKRAQSWSNMLKESPTDSKFKKFRNGALRKIKSLQELLS